MRRVEGLILRLVAALIGVRVNSWFRSPSHNAEVGGLPTSYHLWGGAIDVPADISDWQRRILSSFAREVDETATKNHWHYQVDGRSWPVVATLAGLVVVWVSSSVSSEKGGK